MVGFNLRFGGFETIKNRIACECNQIYENKTRIDMTQAWGGEMLRMVFVLILNQNLVRSVLWMCMVKENDNWSRFGMIYVAIMPQTVHLSFQAGRKLFSSQHSNTTKKNSN